MPSQIFRPSCDSSACTRGVSSPLSAVVGAVREAGLASAVGAGRSCSSTTAKLTADVDEVGVTGAGGGGTTSRIAGPGESINDSAAAEIASSAFPMGGSNVSITPATLGSAWADAGVVAWAASEDASNCAA